MKTLFAILLLSGVAFSASAQHSRGGHRANSHVSVGIGSRSTFGTGYGYGYNRFNSPFNTFPSTSYRYSRPSKLDLNIQDIENEYRDRIWSVRHDKALPRQQRKENVRALKSERRNAIIEARRGYYTKRY